MGCGLQFLTNWNLLLNFIIAGCALLNERNSKFNLLFLVTSFNGVECSRIFIILDHKITFLVALYAPGGWTIFQS